MQTVIVVGAGEPAGRQVLAWLAGQRAEFMVDGLVDDGTDPRWLAEQLTDFAPLRLGVTDEYAAASVLHERDEIALDAGLVDWELPELDVALGEPAAAEVAALTADFAVIALPGELGAEATRAALVAGTGQVWWLAEAAGVQTAERVHRGGVAELLEAFGAHR